MNKRDFFLIMIKLAGIFSLIGMIDLIAPFLWSMLSIDMEIQELIRIIFLLILTGLIYWFMIKDANRLVVAMKLDEGFVEERIDLGNIKTEDIFRIALIILGLLLLINNLPLFIQHAFRAFQNSVLENEYDDNNKFDWGVASVKMVIGFLLVRNYSLVLSWFPVANREEEELAPLDADHKKL
jgi:hypothetical protein